MDDYVFSVEAHQGVACVVEFSQDPVPGVPFRHRFPPSEHWEDEHWEDEHWEDEHWEDEHYSHAHFRTWSRPAG